MHEVIYRRTHKTTSLRSIDPVCKLITSLSYLWQACYISMSLSHQLSRACQIMMYVSCISGRIKGYMFSGLTLGLGRLWVMSRSSGMITCFGCILCWCFGFYFVLGWVQYHICFIANFAITIFSSWVIFTAWNLFLFSPGLHMCRSCIFLQTLNLILFIPDLHMHRNIIRIVV